MEESFFYVEEKYSNSDEESVERNREGWLPCMNKLRMFCQIKSHASCFNLGKECWTNDEKDFNKFVGKCKLHSLIEINSNSRMDSQNLLCAQAQPIKVRINWSFIWGLRRTLLHVNTTKKTEDHLLYMYIYEAEVCLTWTPFPEYLLKWVRKEGKTCNMESLQV